MSTAIVLREAGGLGDVLQVASLFPLLKRGGYDRTVFYTLKDPAILTLAGLVQDLDFVMGLKMTIDQRRPRYYTEYEKVPYLRDMLAAMQDGDTLIDCWCPGLAHEMEEVRAGRLPRLSRAQAFAKQAGFAPRAVQPARLKHDPRTLSPGLSRWVAGRIGAPWVLFHFRSKDPARSLSDEKALAVTRELALHWPVVVFDYPSKRGHPPDIPGVFWFSGEVNSNNMTRAVHAAFSLAAHASVVVAVDSFMFHAARVVETPVVLLCGPTDPDPLTAHYKEVHWPDRSCESCYYQQSRGFSERCRRDGCRSLEALDLNELVSFVKEAQR